MDASSLARDLDNLEKSWSGLDWWLDFWTFLVVVGVAVELLVIIIEFVHDWKDFRRRIIHSPDKPSIFRFAFGFIGAALVAIGVAGELHIHVHAGKTESDMRSKSRELVAIIEKDAQEAGERASKADLARIQLEKSMEWRHLPDKARSAFCVLPPPTADVDVAVITLVEDLEPKRYATEIADAIAACSGTQRRMLALSEWPYPTRSGIWIDFPARDRKLAQDLQASLLKNGVQISGISDFQRRAIFVGPRPLPEDK